MTNAEFHTNNTNVSVKGSEMQTLYHLRIKDAVGCAEVMSLRNWVQDIKNNAWVSIFCHEWGYLAMISTSDEVMSTSENHCWIVSPVTKKSLFTVTNVLFYFLLPILCPVHTILLKTIINRWFRHCAMVSIFWPSIVTSPQLSCDVTRTWGTGIVTSYSLIVLAHANWRKGDLHKWITTVNIDFSPPGIHGLACKRILLLVYVWTTGNAWVHTEHCGNLCPGTI